MEAVGPARETLDACLIFPSMPAVMKLNKLGSFSMSQVGWLGESLHWVITAITQQAGQDGRAMALAQPRCWLAWALVSFGCGEAGAACSFGALCLQL